MNYNGIPEDNIVYKEYNNGRRKKAVIRKCDNCGGEYKAPIGNLRKGWGRFCSRSCNAKYNHMIKSAYKDKEAKEQANKIEWSSELGYLVGLIVSDGNLTKDKSKVRFTSKDRELIGHFQDIVENNYKDKHYDIMEQSRGDSKWYVYQFTSRKLYYFLKSIGVNPNKSLTIGKVDVPNEYFADFLRGEIDGDGSFRGCGDENNFSLSIYSGSEKFLTWLFKKIKENVNVQGGSISNNDCYRLLFGTNDTIDIANYIYNGGKCLPRKREYIMEKINQHEDRSYLGNANNKKLSVEKSKRISYKYESNEMALAELSEEYNVSVNTIWKVVNNKHWTTR